MLYTWEECDVYCGRKVQSRNRGEISIIGYDPWQDKPFNMALISLADGQITKKGLDLPGMVAFLNECRLRPTELQPGDVQKPKAVEP